VSFVGTGDIVPSRPDVVVVDPHKPFD